MLKRSTMAGAALAALLACSLAAQAQAPALPAPEPDRAAEAADAAVVDEAFRRADLDADGRLSSAELGQFPALASRLDDLDADRDGFVSSAEFAARVTRRRD